MSELPAKLLDLPVDAIKNIHMHAHKQEHMTIWEHIGYIF